ncbi:MAG: GYF domain-containing protein [Pseudobdellovibrionaceae bacterium]
MKTWYYNENLKPVGPVTFEDIVSKIQYGSIRPYDFILNEADEQAQWVAAIACKQIRQDFFPAFQSIESEISAGPTENKKIWVILKVGLQTTGQQEGPFTKEEVLESLQTGLLKFSDYVWKQGLSGWACIKDRIEFQESFKNQQQEGVL